MSVIPYHDLIFHPDEYQPLGSVKSVKNLLTPISINDLRTQFLNQDNIIMLINNLYKIYCQNGGQLTMINFAPVIKKAIHEFSQITDFDNYMTVESQAFGFNNYVEALKTLNNDFIKYAYDHVLKWNRFVPTRSWAEVGPVDDRREVRFNKMLADDKTTLDLWRTQEVQRMNRHFRFNNAIPFWQRTMHNRHYDRSNEGLHANNPDRASLNTPMRPDYDMSNIHQLIDKWTQDDWFGF